VEHLTPPQSNDIVPITHPVRMEGARVQGTAIAMQFTGTEMNYLIVADNAETAPVWASESDVSLAYIGQRPS
jgi:hypothetical protein